MNATFVFLFLFFSQNFAQLISPDLAIAYIKDKLLNIIDETLDSECGTDLKLLVSGLEKKQLWALKMIDSSAKPGSGMLKGHVFHAGDYEQCLDVNEVVNGREIVGKYCNMLFKPNKNFPWGHSGLRQDLIAQLNTSTNLFRGVFDICIPKSCKGQDFINIWNDLSGGYHLPVDATIQEQHCHYKNQPIETDSVEIFIFLFFAIMAMVVIGSTAYEFYLENHNEKIRPSQRILTSFSLITNGRKFLSTHCENENLTCLYGLKVLSMCAVVGGHIGVMRAAISAKNPILFFSKEWREQWHNSILLGTFFAVETYFCMGGVLISYLQLKYSDKYQIKAFMFYFHRLFRLVPALFAVILFYIGILKYMGEGPFWTLVLNLFVDNCRKSWWATLLFFSNYLDPFAQCVAHSWYIAVDTQFYVFAPLLIINLKQHPTKTMAVMIFACFVCMIYTFIVTMKYNFGAILFFDGDMNFMKFFYLTPVAHLAPWSCGVFLGYVLYRQNHQKYLLPRRKSRTLMLISLSTIFTLYLLCTLMIKHSKEPFWSALFNCFIRPIWSLAICLLIYICSSGQGGFVNTFLSNPFFIVLGKLSYSVYLIHIAVIFIIFQGIRQDTSYISDMILFLDFCGTIFVTVIFGIILTLVFESPFITLLQLLERSDYSKKKIIR